MVEAKKKLKTTGLRPPTPEELERRHKIVEELRQLRESLEPLGFDAADLIREGRDDPDEEIG